MVRHILKKDWLLLWPFVAALTTLQALIAWARFTAGPPPNTVPSVPAAFLVLLGTSLLIALVVHQDPIPGTRQDWLTRPIGRGDLFLAKLLFVVALVQGPWFVADVGQGLANGFAFGESVAAAAACAVWVLLTVTVPVLAFAACTASMAQTLVAAVAVLAVLIVPALVGAISPTALTGFAWVPALLREALLLGAAIGVLILQYRWRRTWAARTLFAAALLLGIGLRFLPWPTTFGLGQLLVASAGTAQQVAVAFAPEHGRLRLAPGQGLDDVVEKPNFGAADVAAENQRRRAEGARTVFVPVRITGLTPNSRLLADRSEVTILDRDGRRLYHGPGNDLELRAPGSEAAVHQGIRVPGALFGRVKADPVDVQVEYSFTVFQPHATYALAARDGEQRMPGIGLCSTNVNDAGTSVLLRCAQPGERPSCLTVALEHTPTGQRNPDVSMCAPDYSPYPGHVLPDAISRFTGSVPFYDPSGAIRYPVGGPQLAEARLIVTDFRPAAHFVKRIVVPALRLQDWEPAAPSTAKR